jgi:hypothetical protein
MIRLCIQIRNGVHLRPSHLTFTKIDFKKKFIQGKVIGSIKELQSRGPEIIYSWSQQAHTSKFTSSQQSIKQTM